MSKDPAFLFYPGDWLGGTLTFTRHEKGAYIDLLMVQFNQFALTIDDIKQVLGDDYDKMWDRKLKFKFKEESTGLFFNVKLREETIKRKRWCLSRENNKEGNNQYSKKRGHMTSHMSGHMSGHMENENYIYICKSSTHQNTTKTTESSDTTIPNKYILLNFEDIWSKYPKRIGKKEALRHFKASVKNEIDYDNINLALNNYIKSESVMKGFIQNGSTWFNNWKDWIDIKPQEDQKFDENGVPLEFCTKKSKVI